MNLYDHPQYLDATFRDETKPEADFIEAASRIYGRGGARHMLESGCGGGRLLVEMARRGVHMIGFDISEPALAYLRQRLARCRLSADLFQADLAEFQVRRRVDAAFCTFNTFRHLLTEAEAVQHLRCVAAAVKPGGIYVLGLHLLPLDVDESCIERWRGQQGRASISVTLRVLSTDRRRRIEWLRLSLLVRQDGRIKRSRTEFPLRMYTASQFRRLLRQVPEFELADVFDFWYDIREPLALDDWITDAVFILRRRRDP